MRVLILLLVAASPVVAGHREDAEVALALARAKATCCKPQIYTDLAAAKAEAKASGKPLFVRSGGLDCSELCKTLRPEYLVAHTSGEPGCTLYWYDSSGSLWNLATWATVPTDAEVRAAKTRGVASICTTCVSK